eukprot:5716574-Karenia_brevis.AAC.1
MADQNRVVPWDTQPMDSSGSDGGNSMQTTSAKLPQLPPGPAIQFGPGGQMMPVVRSREVA